MKNIFLELKNGKSRSKSGFTLLELIIVIAIIIIITSTALGSMGSFLVDTYLDSKAAEILQTLKLAQTRSVARYFNDQWGVYFDEDAPGNGDKFVLFKGTSYASRDVSFDIVTNLPDSISLSDIILNGGGSEVLFAKLTGTTTNDGSLQLSANDGSVAAKVISINSQGLIALNETPGGGGPSPDISAPSAIADFAISNITETSVDLSWSAPGDDNNTGTASSYDIRYSTSLITEANWAAATAVPGEPTPSVAGSAESMTVTGLNSSTTYYFAIKTSDEVPNISSLSNVPSVTTQSPPASDYLLVDVGSVYLSNANKQLMGITIQNTGISAITIDKMTVTWSGGSNGSKVTQLVIDGSTKWSGSSNSGTLLDITDFTLSSGAGSYIIDRIVFSKSMAGANISIMFTMSDTSTLTISNIQP